MTNFRGNCYRLSLLLGNDRCFYTGRNLQFDCPSTAFFGATVEHVVPRSHDFNQDSMVIRHKDLVFNQNVVLAAQHINKAIGAAPMGIKLMVHEFFSDYGRYSFTNHEAETKFYKKKLGELLEQFRVSKCLSWEYYGMKDNLELRKRCIDRLAEIEVSLQKRYGTGDEQLQIYLSLYRDYNCKLREDVLL